MQHAYDTKPREVTVEPLYEMGEPMEILATVVLPDRGESVAAARRTVEAVVGAWGLGEVSESAVLLTSELMGNAVKHGEGLSTGCGKLSVVQLKVLRRRDRLRVEVHDGSERVPVLREVTDEDEDGRGWLLVGLLAEEHGVTRTVDGKAVWFELVAW
jgi:anti-sigma regulatory factor (Ser/Thr protein kinase)